MGYKFDIGDRVRITSIEEDGEVLSRRFSLMSLEHMSFLPGNYYVVMLQDEFYLDGKKDRVNFQKVESPERDLEYSSLN